MLSSRSGERGGLGRCLVVTEAIVQGAGPSVHFTVLGTWDHNLRITYRHPP